MWQYSPYSWRTAMDEKLVKFVRQKDYVLIKELGAGACGQTVLLRDDTIDTLFVCKKYAPLLEQFRSEHYENFVREITLLHGLHHQNVVRVFNHYLYPDKLTGYILMEYIEGAHVEEHLKNNPESISDIFTQTIEGFCHLNDRNILHRDIRPYNLMVSKNGIVKIIDLGFGKQVKAETDFEKSVSLNWWCTTPMEFESKIYDFGTEVYFVGQLFQEIISENNIQGFRFPAILEKMCNRDPTGRYPTFSDVRSDMAEKDFSTIEFTQDEISSYREFSDKIIAAITKIHEEAKYTDDVPRIISQLREICDRCILEGKIYNPVDLLRVFIRGSYHYKPAYAVWHFVIDNFSKLIATSPPEKQRIILANLHSRFDGVKRYSAPNFDHLDDIPF
jgi:serine/threonine-protein kinase